MRDPSDITPLQADILEVIRANDGATAADVRNALAERAPLARTTVATMLGRMEQYGWLTRVRTGREFTYRAAIARTAMRSAQMRRMIGSLFRHDLPSLVSHALREGDWEEEDLLEIEKMIRDSRDRRVREDER